MNASTESLGFALACRVGWVLLHSLWQGALIGLAFGLVRLATHSAKLRYVAGCLALALLVAAPVAGFLTGWLPAPAIASSLAPAPAAGGVPFHWMEAGTASAGGAVEVFASRSAAFLARLAPVLAGLWLFGVLLCSCRLTRSFWRVRTIRTRAKESVDAGWLEVLNDLRCRLGISRPVGLIKSALVEVPAVIGWWRPVILLPAATLAGLAPSQLEAILAHELAHVRRLDYLVNAVQCVVETLLFYHPVVWWISRCVRDERENCCDDLVVEVCGDRVAYARALATLEESRVEVPRLAFAATGGSLLSRIRRLLGAADDRPGSVRQIGGLALLALGLVLIVLGVCLFVSSPSYQALARIKLERDLPDGPAMPYQRPATADPYFIQTEIATIRSAAVLDSVIASLDLNRQWGLRYRKDGALKTLETEALLRRRLALVPVRNTSLLEVRASGDDRAETARLANEIAQAYRAYRSRQREELTSASIRSLEERWKQQETSIREAQRNVDYLRDKLKIYDPSSGAEMSRPLLTTESLRRIESLRIETSAELVRDETLLNHLRELQRTNPAALVEILPVTAPDAYLSSLMEQMTVAHQRLVMVQQDYGPENLEVKKARESVTDLHGRITDRVSGIMLGLEAKVASTRESLEQMKKQVDEAMAMDISKASESAPYWKAKRELEEQEHFRQILDLKILSEKVDLPKTSMVEIIEPAVPPLCIVSPNRMQAASMIGLGVLLDILGLLLLRTSAPTRTPPKSATALGCPAC
ncbi:membrane hypothetical protein [Verrucomicrobia bacterium]|nr:membrane hypothetical protein [Verrucomicrobiota bacterium]